MKKIFAFFVVLSVVLSPTSLHAQTLNDLYNTVLAIQKSLNNVGQKSLAQVVTGQQAPLNYVVPALPQRYVDTTFPNQTGRTISVLANGDFQTAINQAVLGDTIVLQAGATYSGNFVLPNKNSNGQWIVITSSALNSLPPQGIRVSKADAMHMPKIVTPNAASAIDAEQGASHLDWSASK